MFGYKLPSAYQPKRIQKKNKQLKSYFAILFRVSLRLLRIRH